MDTPDRTPHALSLSLLRAGRAAEAERACRAALDIKPDDAAALYVLGMIVYAAGRGAEAVDLLRRSLAIDGGAAHVHNNLGAILGSLGQTEAALACIREAIRLRPGMASAHNNLGVALERAGRLAEAEAAYRRAVALDPDDAEAHNHLGNALRQLGRIAGAADAHRRALRLRPGFAAAETNLALALCEQGRTEEAAAHYRAVVARQPDDARAHSNLLYALHYDGDLDPADLAAEHVRWAGRHGRSPAGPGQTRRWPNDPAPDRVIRVGYYSPDFRQHPVGVFMEPVLRGHRAAAAVAAGDDGDASGPDWAAGGVEAICYHDDPRTDAVTARLRRLAGGWRDVAGWGDAAVDEAVRADRIDVLVDLAGHGAHNRLSLFARQPAPVQVAYLGYPNTTGLAAVGWRITDATTDPPDGQSDRLYAERLVRLDRPIWCYQPPPGCPPPRAPAARSPGRPFTFGCFNNVAKCNPRVLRTWAAVLRASAPGSRLLLKWGGLGDDATRRAVRDRCAAHGIPPDRLGLCGPQPTPAQHMGMYAEVDVALDPFPYNGTTTTCDALWMGVPVVTLLGRSHASRVGASLLSAVGLPAFVAPTIEEYVGRAAGWSRSPDALAAVRDGLRQAMIASPLCDERGLAAALAGAYRAAWRDWCGRQRAATDARSEHH